MGVRPGEGVPESIIPAASFDYLLMIVADAGLVDKQIQRVSVKF